MSIGYMVNPDVIKQEQEYNRKSKIKFEEFKFQYNKLKNNLLDDIKKRENYFKYSLDLIEN